MLNRLTVSALLKAVILTTALIIIAGVSLSAWGSWQRLQTTSRISVMTEISANLFQAMHNLRTDRSTTSRQLNNFDPPIEPEIEKYLRGLRATEMPAMAKGLELLTTFDFPEQKTVVPELDRLYRKLTEQHAEFWTEIIKPKAQRRPALVKEFMETTQALLDTLDKLSGILAANVNHQDATIDQLLAIKQAAWLLRNTAGEASLVVVTGLANGQLSPEAHQAYTRYVGGSDTAWKALELATGGMQLSPALSAAMTATKTAYFDAEYLKLRERLATALANGEKAELSANQWTPLTVGRMSTAVTVAETALNAAKEHSATQSSMAFRSLVLQLGLLIAAVALTFGAMTMVGRRVIRPLHTIRDAMLKVAAGDLAVETG
jgi:hypothetical protein